jgi:hypothetical protein
MWVRKLPIKNICLYINKIENMETLTLQLKISGLKNSPKKPF